MSGASGGEGVAVSAGAAARTTRVPSDDAASVCVGERVRSGGRIRVPLTSPTHLCRHTAKLDALPRNRVRQDAAAQPARPRHGAGGHSTGRLLGAAAERPLSRRHSTIPLLSIQPRLPGPSYLPMSQPL